jgi:hypothetical protein
VLWRVTNYTETHSQQQQHTTVVYCVLHIILTPVDMLGLLLLLLLLLLQLFKAAVKWVKHSAALDWLKSRLPQPLVEGVRHLVHRQKRHVRPLSVVQLPSLNRCQPLQAATANQLTAALLHCITLRTTQHMQCAGTAAAAASEREEKSVHP